MSLESLMASDWADWDEIETGKLLLVGVRFTPNFSDFIWDTFGHYVDIAGCNLLHSFGAEYPVIIQVENRELKISVELFTEFLARYAAK